MQLHLASWWEKVRSSYWAMPAAMALGAGLLAHGAIQSDRWLQTSNLDLQEWMYRGGADGARVLLSTIVNAMMAVTGVVFSIAVVVLTLASDQFGPHLLRNFIRDRGNQFTLGTFISTFIYSLLVLRTVYEKEVINFVPNVGITLAILLTLASTAVLIYFIHHISTKIQADEVIADVVRELADTIDRLREPAEKSTQELAPETLRNSPAVIRAREDNYIQFINVESAYEIAVRENIAICFLHRPGKYVPGDGVIASIWPPEKLTDDLAEKIRATCMLGARRTPQQDVEYGILQLVEIAVRALSAGRTDPFTAIACIDRLGSVVRRLAEHPAQICNRSSPDGQLCVAISNTDFSGHLDAAFDQIRQNAGTSVGVLMRVLEALAMIAEKADTEEKREAVRRQADLVVAAGDRCVPEPADAASVRERYERVLHTLDAGFCKS